MKKFFLLAAIALFLLVPTAFAEKQNIVAEGTYVMGDRDSREIAAQKAMENAHRLAREKAGYYIESYAKTENHKLTQDEIEIVMAEKYQVIAVSPPTYTIDGDTMVCHIIVNAEVDDTGTDYAEVIRRHRAARPAAPPAPAPSKGIRVLIIDCRDVVLATKQEHRRCRFEPFRNDGVVYDDYGRMIYGLGIFSEAQLKKIRASTTYIAYAADKAADPLMQNPLRDGVALMVKAISAAAVPGKSDVYRDLTVSRADADKILAENDKTQFLQERRVIIWYPPNYEVSNMNLGLF